MKTRRPHITPEQSGASSIEPVEVRSTEQLRIWRTTLIGGIPLSRFNQGRLQAIVDELSRREHIARDNDSRERWLHSPLGNEKATTANQNRRFAVENENGCE
jgi:hypothetical protein